MDDVTEDSLVLVDELGKGTEVRAGAAIAGAMLERLDIIGCRGIFATSVFFFISALRIDSSPSSILLLVRCLTIAGAMLERLDTIGCRGIFATSVFLSIALLPVFHFFLCIAWQGPPLLEPCWRS